MNRDRSSNPGSGQSLELRETLVGKARVITVHGEIDMLSAPALATRLTHVLEHRPAIVIIDLLQVAFLAAAGLAVLVEAHQHAVAHGTAVRVVATGPWTARPIGLTHLDTILELFPDLESALAG